MKVLLCGDRNWKNYLIIETFVAGLYSQYGDQLIIIEGEARGADKMAAEAASLFIPEERIHRYPAQWDKHGKSAGPIRNREMLKEEPDVVIAFHSDIENSKGTKDMANAASEKNIPVYVVGKYNE